MMFEDAMITVKTFQYKVIGLSVLFINLGRAPNKLNTL